jgi:valyl-tRNA synthetase
MTEDASAEQQARARIDLAIEIHYLRVLSHPNIIKIRGLLNSQQLFDPKCSFLMDKLYETLHDKIGKWKECIERTKMNLLCTFLNPFRNSKRCNNYLEFMKERMLVAHDIASALAYIHGKKVIHR